MLGDIFSVFGHYDFKTVGACMFKFKLIGCQMQTLNENIKEVSQLFGSKEKGLNVYYIIVWSVKYMYLHWPSCIQTVGIIVFSSQSAFQITNTCVIFVQAFLKRTQS